MGKNQAEHDKKGPELAEKEKDCTGQCVKPVAMTNRGTCPAQNHDYTDNLFDSLVDSGKPNQRLRPAAGKSMWSHH